MNTYSPGQVKRDEIYNFVKEYQEKNKRPPTYREICKACKISSTSVVDYHIKQLVKENRMTKHFGYRNI